MVKNDLLEISVKENIGSGFIWILALKKQTLPSGSAACDTFKMTASYESEKNILYHVNYVNQNTG